MRNTPEQLVARLLTIFGEPRVEAPDEYIREFVAAIDGWDGEVLQAAGTEVVRTARFFPRPAEVLEVARRISAERSAARARQQPPRSEGQMPPLTPAQRERADRIMRMFRSAMADHVLGDEERRPAKCANRDEMERLQRSSPNRHLHTSLTGGV